MTPSLSLHVASSIRDIPRNTWERLVGASPIPTLRWEWLDALEASGSASKESGWEPAHLTLRRGDEVIAAAPAYRKHHSMGEYIYDFAWADAAGRLGIQYYPKLLIAAPLSPVTAPRILVAPGENTPQARAAFMKAAVDYAHQSGCSSAHVLYPPEAEATELASLGFARRTTIQFHWRNPGYNTYEEFLSRFDSKRRHQLRRERAAVAKAGIEIVSVRGDELRREHAHRAYDFYFSTCDKNPWGLVQLNREFFERVFDTMKDCVELVEARRNGKVIAGAFNLATPERLLGRYWGAFEEHPFLHFNVCFYHSIDECIRLGRRIFEPGAGGEHKMARGFEPSAVHSVHHIFDPRLDHAIRAFLRREADAYRATLAESEAFIGMKPWKPG